MNQDRQNDTSKLGKGMIIASWIIGLALLTLMFNDQLARQFNPNQQPESAFSSGKIEVRLKQNRQGHYVASGTINGQPVVFLLDTGATNVSVPAHLQQELGLIAGRTMIASTANGNVQVAQTRVDALTIGELTLRDIEASLNPGMKSDKVLLGMSALRQLEFTQTGEWLILRG
jgi:aspartyl protease family protein